RHEVDSGGAREAGLPAALIALLEVHAGAVGESSLHSGNQVSLADLRAVVRALVFQRVVEIKIGQIGIEKGGADFSTRPEVSVGSLSVDLETFRQAIRAARADATIAFTAAARRDGILDKAVGVPGSAGVEHELRDRVRALTLFLGQGNNQRMVIAQ